MQQLELATPVTEDSDTSRGRINFIVPPEIKRQWKIAAIQNNTSMTELIKTAMERHLSIGSDASAKK